MKKKLKNEDFGRYLGITITKTNDDFKSVFMIKEWNLVYLLQIIQIYSYSFLKYHNIIDLSTLYMNITTEKEDYHLVPFFKQLINTRRVKVLIHLEWK